MKPCPVYLFRSPAFAPSGDTIVGAAPLDKVIEVYGAGGVWGEAGLSSAFGGVAVFKNDVTGERFAGAWGARKVARFRREFEASIPITVIEETPDARLAFHETKPRRTR